MVTYAKLDVVVFVHDQAIRKAIKAGLSHIGNTNMRLPNDTDSAIDHLSNLPAALLIIDWRGFDTIQVLDGSRGSQAFDPRHILMIVDKPEGGFLQIITDYHINGVHAGVPTSEDISRNIMQIMDKDHPINAFKNSFAKVVHLKQKGQWHEATAIVEEMVAATPNNNKMRLELATLHMDQRDWDSAEKIIDVVLLRDLNMPRALHLKARCLLQRRKVTNAREYLRLATNLNPFNADRLIDFGEVLLKLCEPRAALKAFERAGQITGDDDKRVVSGSQRSRLLLGDYNEVLDLVAQMTSEQERAALFNNAAILCVANREYAKAIKLYGLGIGVIEDPHLKAKMMFNKSLSFIKSGNRAEAIKLCQAAMAEDPAYQRAHSLLSRLQASSGPPELLDVNADEDIVDADLAVLDLAEMDEYF